MNWGRRLKRAFTENWREKIISLVLAFLFWFMIKAQDVRHTPSYLMPPPQQAQLLQIMQQQQSTLAPAELEPVLPPSAVPVPSQLTPRLQQPTLPLAPDSPLNPTPGIDSAAGATGL